MFGATSSPSCCNYELKRTAVINGGKKYHLDVATTLQKSFYVNDWLKLVRDVQTTIKLQYGITGMSASGGFKLSNIISNREEVLESVIETERRKDVKNVHLNNGIDFPAERALAVEWNIGNDQLGFTVILHDKPFTRREILSMISKFMIHWD